MAGSRTDSECVELCLDGHPEAFGELVERYRPALWSYVHGMVGNAEQTEETVQEAFVRAYFSLQNLRKQEAFYSWLFGIAGNVLREERRAKSRREKLSPRGFPGRDQKAPSYDDELQLAVVRLSPPYRDAILLHYYSGLSCAEVAERMGLSVGTVTKNLSRAYAMLRTTMKSESASGRSEKQP